MKDMVKTVFYSRRLAGLLLLCSLAGLHGCATQTPAERATMTSLDSPEAAAPEPEIKYRPFDLQTLYSLLVADIAAQRNRYDIALRNYLRQAAKTEDPGIARYATVMSELLQAEAVALRASELWARSAPGDSSALQSAAIHQARAQDLDQALAYMTGALRLGGNTNFTELAEAAAQLTHGRKQEVLKQMEELLQEYPKNAELWLGVALLQGKLNQHTAALESVNQSLALAPKDQQQHRIGASILRAQTLEELNRTEDAISVIEAALEEFGENKRLGLQYARLLTRTDMRLAEDQFESLASRHPDDHELQFTLALVYRENQQLDKARDILEGLLELDSDNPSVHYYLGIVFEDQGDDDTALEHYSLVQPGQMFISAQARYSDILGNRNDVDGAVNYLAGLADTYPDHEVDLTLLSSNLLTRHGMLERSHAVLTGALQTHPKNQDILYARSMLNEKRQDLAAAEQDLRRLLELDPNNAAALNALGYTLTVHTDRYDEALELIEKAFAIKPEDPAIIDSMGWIHFRLGNIEVAIEHLRKAYQMFPDPEVAAHLGEALWAAGAQDEAREVWRNALDAAPDNQFLLDIVERFGAP